MDARDFQRFLKTERRENTRHTLGQHGLARAGRPDEQKVMRPRGGYLHSTLGTFLPLYVSKIEGEQGVLFGSRRLAGRKLNLPHKEGHCLAKGLSRKNGKPLYNSGFICIFRRSDKASGLFVTSKQGKREHSGNGLQTPIERKFGRSEPAVQNISRNDARSGQKAKGQWQVVRRTFFTAISRGKVHRDAGSWKTEARILQGLEHTLTRFTHSTFGKAYHHEGRHALPTAIDLKIDPVGINAMKGAAGKPYDHVDLTY